MDYKWIFCIVALAVIVIALLFKSRVKGKVGPFNIDAENANNKMIIKGNHNEGDQSSKGKNSNEVRVEGDNNKFAQRS